MADHYNGKVWTSNADHYNGKLWTSNADHSNGLYIDALMAG
jgi:hypothetical protein